MNWKHAQWPNLTNYDGKECRKTCTRFCTRIYDKFLLLCGILQYRKFRFVIDWMVFWYCVALCEIIRFRASLSAINLENQGFAKFVHENVHETPDFNTISGVFYCIFPTDVHERSPAQNRASTLFPGATPGLSQQCGCKDTPFIIKSSKFPKESFLSNWQSGFFSGKATRQHPTRQ